MQRVIALSWIAVVIIAFPFSARAQTTTQPKSEPIIFTPEVPLPLFAGGAISADTFGQYLRAVFVSFIWFVGALAVVMVTYGGVRWVAAAGNPGRINEARETINNALIGLIIALTSIVLLNLIDKRLTTFQGLTLKTVTSNPLVFDNVVGLYGEGSSAKGCNTKSGKPIQAEPTCFVSGQQFAWPVADAPREITSTVGPRQVQGAASASTCHAGTDFSTDRKTDKIIRAAHAGTVEVSATKVANEFSVIIRGDGFFTRYLHLSSLIVTNGLRVGAGELLGTSGGDPKIAKGWSSAPHLHVELYSSSGELHDLEPCMLK